jgi:hypothetical protein
MPWDGSSTTAQSWPEEHKFDSELADLGMGFEILAAFGFAFGPASPLAWDLDDHDIMVDGWGGEQFTHLAVRVQKRHSDRLREKVLIYPKTITFRYFV